jgi:hypothetical protein
MIDAIKYPNIHYALDILRVEFPENYNSLTKRFNLDFIEMEMERLRTEMTDSGDNYSDLILGDASLSVMYNSQIVDQFLDWIFAYEI